MSEHDHERVANDVQTIMKLAQEYDLDALTVVDGDFELSLTRREPALAHAPVPQATSVAPAVPVVPAVTAGTETQGASGNVVAAPIIGVFYRASAPIAPAFVTIGDRVSIGQTLCILEAMKLMNEITSDFNGVVTSIHVENGELVTIGQPLFTVSPSA